MPSEIMVALGLSAGASVADVLKAIEARGSPEFDANALRDGVAAAVRAETEALRADLAAMREGLADPSALVGYTPADAVNDDDRPGPARPLEVYDFGAAAGGGTVDIDNARTTRRMWFSREWLDKHGLDATQCIVIKVEGESMEPTLMDGSKIMIDRSRTRRRSGHIYVIRTDDGLIVKRLRRDNGDWMLVSDHPAKEPVRFPDDAEIIGRVVWTSRTLVGERW